MRIEKVLNNNVVLSRNEQGEEIVYMGRGLAFQRRLETRSIQIMLKRNSC